MKLLRVLEDEKIRRVGETRDLKVDVRIITATHRDLQAETKAGRFREDLFYRLNVLPIHVPPLRERRDDIALLVEHFITRNNARLGTRISGLDTEARRLLYEYGWPGNIREMENTLEHAFIVCRQSTITVDHLPQNLKDFHEKMAPLAADQDEIGPEAVIEALQKAGWNKSKAARLLGVNVRTIYRKMEKFNISTEKLI